MLTSDFIKQINAAERYLMLRKYHKMVKWRKKLPDIDGYYWLWPKGYCPEIVLVQTDPFSDEQQTIIWDVGSDKPHKFQKGLQYLWLPITEPLHTDKEWENAE